MAEDRRFLRGPLLTAAALAGMLSACWTTVRPTKPIPHPIGEPEPVAVASPGGSATVDADGTAPTPAPSSAVTVGELPIPKVELTELSGPGAASLNAAYVPIIRDHLESCGAKKGDIVEVTLITENGDILTRLRKSTADATVGACVVQRLAVDMDNVLSPSKSPSERLEDVQSILTIRW